MAGKERSIQIVDSVGNVVVGLDGDDIAIKDSAGRFLYGPIVLQWPLVGTSVDSFIWTCREGVWQMQYVTSVITVTGGAGAAAQVVVCPGSVAIASGTAQLTAVLDLEETAPNKQTGVLIASPTKIYPGDSAAVDLSGTLGGLVACLSVELKRIG